MTRIPMMKSPLPTPVVLKDVGGSVVNRPRELLHTSQSPLFAKLLSRVLLLGLGSVVLTLGLPKISIAADSTSQDVGILRPASLETAIAAVQQPTLPPLDDAPTYLPGLSVHLVVKLGERRVYVYEGDRVKVSYPIAVGKSGWETPVGTYNVFSLEKDPIFKSFKSGRIIMPGPDNPLGPRWIGIWTDGKTQLGFHGTNQEELIGQAVSHGCIRMRNRDVLALFEQVEMGTRVIVQP